MSGSFVVLWDFDGTLARRRSGMWCACLLQLLDRELPDHTITRQTLSPYLQHGFPWHDHQREHPHLDEPARWWQHVNGVLARALGRAGLEPQEANRVVTAGFRDLYLHPDEWQLFSDSAAALASVTEVGGRNVIVSNHVPALPDLVAALGLSAFIQGVVTSAMVGAEKPHPAIFQAALGSAREQASTWLVGGQPGR